MFHAIENLTICTLNAISVTFNYVWQTHVADICMTSLQYLTYYTTFKIVIRLTYNEYKWIEILTNFIYI